MIFFTANIDRQTTSADHLLNSRSSVIGSRCFLIGAGASLNDYTQTTLDHINNCGVPKFGVNYGGFVDGKGWVVRPDIWTTYDPTIRFSSNLMWSPNVLKFFRGSRFLDLVPGSTFKVCDTPQSYFFHSEHKQYDTFFGTERIVDSKDSFIQAIDIAIRLGFRELCCVGVDMRVYPSQAFLQLLTDTGVDHSGTQGVIKSIKVGDNKRTVVSDRLKDYVIAYTAKMRCSYATAIKNIEDYCASEKSGTTQSQYCFAETKPLATAVNCDEHYWNNAQYLRQARGSLARNGVKLYVEEDSRLSEFFPVKHPADFGITDDQSLIPADSTIGKYTVDAFHDVVYHEDIKPWAGQPKTVSAAHAQRKAELEKKPIEEEA